MQDQLFLQTDYRNLAATDEDAFLLHRGSGVMVPGKDCLCLNLWTPEIRGSHKRPAVEDAVAVYREILKTYRPNHIVVYGASAGAILTGKMA